MRKFYSYLIFSLLIISAVGCVKIKKTDAEYERDNWIAGFTDSIEYYQKRKSQIEIALQDINSQIVSQLNDFEMIKKPREVSGYYLLKGWSSKIPFSSTGIYARINENEKIELIATLAGSTFNQIEVGSGDSNFFSEVMRHDQAFNFRHERFNTVYFSGGKADTIAQFIAGHYNDKIDLKFLEGKIRKNFQIPENEKNMIRKTWNLYNSQVEARKLQKELFISSKKIDTFHRLLDAHEEKTKQ